MPLPSASVSPNRLKCGRRSKFAATYEGEGRESLLEDCVVCRRSGVCHGRQPCVRAENHYGLVEQGFLQVRRRRADRRDQEVRGQDRHQGRTVAVCDPGHDSEDGGSAGFRHRAGRRLLGFLRRAGAGQVGLRGQARGSLGHHAAHHGQVRAEYAGNHLSLQRPDQEARLLRLPAEAAEHACADLEGPAREGRLQARGHPDRLERLLVVLVRQGAAGDPQGNGKLLVDNPKVREALIKALKDYTDVYVKGCTPPSSTTWKDPDNNVAFHNKTIVMTHNFTISIAAKWYEDSTNPALTEEQRAAGKKAYEQDIITASFPNKPDGTPIKYRSDVKTGLIFANAPHKAQAKEFVKFLMQEENLGPYVEGALGRWFPVTVAGQQSPFWQADRHRKAVYAQFTGGTTPFDFTKNYKFTILNNENVW